jgi:sRNA-binding carbon storage regulator CsrA
MLVLDRLCDEVVVVTHVPSGSVMRIKNLRNHTKLGFDAGAEFNIVREEIYRPVTASAATEPPQETQR